MKKPLIVIAGATATGKSNISIELAKKINGAIISADSMQVYKFMDIGTAKATKEEMDGIEHYLIDCLNPDEEYSVATFQRMAKESLTEIYNKNKIPIVTGGTGFYINSLIYDNDFLSVEADYSYREELALLAKEKGNSFLHKMLTEVDPEAALKIHYNNVKRVIRALEYYKLTSKKISTHNSEESERKTSFQLIFIILNMERSKLYSRIDKRVDNMINSGLVNEVEHLLQMGYNENLTSMQGLGYKEIIPYLKGEYSLDEGINILKRDTRHFAKRQITWFKHQSSGVWLNVDEFSNSCIIVDRIVSEYYDNLKLY